MTVRRIYACTLLPCAVNKPCQIFRNIPYVLPGGSTDYEKLRLELQLKVFVHVKHLPEWGARYMVVVIESSSSQIHSLSGQHDDLRSIHQRWI